MSNYSKKIVYLSDAQRQELFTNNIVTVNGQTITYNDNDIYVTPQAEPIIDVKINNTSISANGVANIPLATSSTPGLVKAYTAGGVSIFTSGTHTGCLYLPSPDDDTIKAGVNGGLSLKPCDQHKATFYGLAKVAGVDMKNSNNEIGTYTDEAKAAIQNMLGVTSLFANEEHSTATAAHTTGSVFLMDGKLYQASDDITIGDAVVEGTNCILSNASSCFLTRVSAMNTYAVKNNPTFTGAFSLGRKANTTIGNYSTTLGYNLTASGSYSYAVGGSTSATGLGAFSEGAGTAANGYTAHAMGYHSTANGDQSLVCGYYTETDNSNSIAMGIFNNKSTVYNTWVANTSYAVGDKVTRITTGTSTLNYYGYECIEANNDATFTSSKWKFLPSNGDKIFTIGNGTANNNKSNALTLNWNGDLHLNKDVYVNSNADGTGGTRLPHDIQINSSSIVSNGVANIPKAGYTDFGVVKVFDGYGIGMVSGGAADGAIGIACATDNLIKIGTSAYKAIVPAHQHEAVFYGLAKAAGADMASSSNAVGTYTQVAKTAIQTMLGIENGAVIVEEVAGTTPTITGIPNYRYKCGEVSTISITPPTNGSIDIRFNSGSTATVMTVPSTVKWPEWFDAENLEANITYEILITDGVYGSVMTWA